MVSGTLYINIHFWCSRRSLDENDYAINVAIVRSREHLPRYGLEPAFGDHHGIFFGWNFSFYECFTW